MFNWLVYWGQLFLLPFYWCGGLFPRKKEIWLFGSTFGRRFADNPRYFYLYCRQHAGEQGIRPVWVSHKEEVVSFLCENGCEAYLYHSLKGILLALTGKVYLYDNYSKDINFWQSRGATKVNLWHGIPLKKIQADNKHDKYRHPRNLWEKWKNFPRNLSDEKPSDWVLTTSEYLKPIFSSAFRTGHVFTSGYPRTDYLISDEIENLLLPVEQGEVNAVKAFLEKYSVEKNSGKEGSVEGTGTGPGAGESLRGDGRIVYYMPTFRDSEKKFFEVMDMVRFQKFLSEENILFCVKLHPKSKLKKEFRSIAESGFPNVLIVDADSDPYVLLKMADVLVTDYSSIYFDFLLLDKPMVFFDYDREEYVTQSRELYFDYDDMTPGEKAETMDGLMEALLRACRSVPEYGREYATERKRIREMVFDTPGEMASPKLVQEIKKRIKG